MRHSANQVQVSSSTSYPITTIESQGLMPTTDLELTLSLGGTLSRKDPFPPCREGGGDPLPSPQSCTPHHIDGVAVGKLNK